ncbi:hypothetical protein LTR84_010995 [Exophiala bonariae]|uniref:Uncharacterized protein n=1 Tax=Exophiala bonariae TaxID=1690606 RepID=A0AAV9NIA5_9EURO|nr:hypothetical protein LTR84_010995 [Exophiala bonariae]
MHAGRMFPNMFSLHKRQQGQGGSDLPSSIGNPNTSLPPTIGPDGIVTDATTAPIATANAISGLTTVVETLTLAQTGPSPTTITTERTKTITNALEYASLTSAAAAKSTSARATSQSASKSTSSPTATAAASSSSSSNLSTLVPAIVVPVVVVLIASLALFWFFMRRRHRRELQSQPEFVMAGKGEKLNSRSSSARSANSSSWPAEKRSPEVPQKEMQSLAKSPPTPNSEWKSPKIGIGISHESFATTGQKSSSQHVAGMVRGEPRPYQNSNGHSSGARPATSGRGQPPIATDREQNRNRSNSTPGQRGMPPSSRSGPSPTPRSGPSPVPRGLPGPNSTNPKQGVTSPLLNGGPIPVTGPLRLRDPSPGMGHNTRAQAPTRLEAPGAYNGNSSISQYSPIVKDTPTSATPVQSNNNKRGPPPPLKTSNFANPRSPATDSPTGLSDENLRIARLATSSRLGYSVGEPSPSPKLPPPATRSQLIPRESPKESHERFFAGSRAHSRENSQEEQHSHKRQSMISDADEYEDIDAKSDISSLNEFERFDFTDGANSRTGSAAGHSLNYFAAQNSPASGRGSPFGNVTLERW